MTKNADVTIVVCALAISAAMSLMTAGVERYRDTRRTKQWDEEWRRVAPLWTEQYRRG